MIAPVPGQVDEPDQGAVRRPGRDPAETVRADAIPPARFWPTTVRHDAVDHLIVGHAASPLIGVVLSHDNQSARYCQRTKTSGWGSVERPGGGQVSR